MQQNTDNNSSGFPWALPVSTAQPIDAASDVQKAFTFGKATTTSKEATDKQTKKLVFKAPQPKMEAEDVEIPNAFRLGGQTTLTKPASSTAAEGVAMPNTLFTFPVGNMLESQWRDLEWTEEHRTSLMKTVSSYRPGCEEVTEARVLLLGPVGSGKSSFISSVQSVFNGRVTNWAMVGSSSTSFTKKLQSFNIHAQKGEGPTGLVLCDVMGLGDGEMTGLTLHDTLSVIKGHVPEGHRFCLDQPVSCETVGYVKKPTLKDKIHCVAFIVDISKLLNYPKGLISAFQKLREHISDLGVHQVALLTHIDQVCQKTAKDASQVYRSRVIKDMIGKAGALLGMSTSYILPVKNYSSELHLDVNADVLLLHAVDHILQYADLYFQDRLR